MAVVGYSMRLANETGSECEKTERKRGTEEKRKRLIEKSRTENPGGVS